MEIPTQLLKCNSTVFEELKDVLLQLQEKEYSLPSQCLSGSTIGQHVRHIIELYKCLEISYSSGILDYDKRKRDLDLEINLELALSMLDTIDSNLEQKNKKLLLEASVGSISEVVQIETNYYREVLYNLEHVIHHMALIRVALKELTLIVVKDSFGVAPSTLRFRELCVQ